MIIDEHITSEPAFGDRQVSVSPGSGPTRRLRRVAWSALGLACVAIGGIGIVVPGLPTTVFFISAAACFSRSSPRLEAWVLSLPRIGPAIRDHRAGLGMSMRSKLIAIGTIAAMVTLSAVLIGSWPVRLVVIAVGAVGVWVIAKQPTKPVGDHAASAP